MANDRKDTVAIGVMAKAPEAGRSKTRLCPPLLPAEAAALSAAFLRDTTQSMAAAARLAPIAAYAAYAPLGSETLLGRHLAAGTDLLLADGSPPMPPEVQGFGRCLLHAVQGMMGLGHTAACVLSADSPTLPTRLLVQTAEILLVPGERAVLGPAEDGGYYLLGLKTTNPMMFADIAWSTVSVADQTRDRARNLGLPLLELQTWYDVDSAASLRVLMGETRGYAAPETNRVVDLLDLRRALTEVTFVGAAE